jgi:hypothetical protein
MVLVAFLGSRLGSQSRKPLRHKQMPKVVGGGQIRKRAGTTPYKRAPLRAMASFPPFGLRPRTGGDGSELDQPGRRSGFDLVTDEIHVRTAMDRFKIERDISSGDEAIAATLGVQRGVHSNEEKEQLDG